MCTIPLIQLFGEISEKELNLYPNLADKITREREEPLGIGYANYGVWQCGDVLVVAIGKFDTNMEWIGYDSVCFNVVEGFTSSLDWVLETVGMEQAAFENMLKAHMMNQLLR